MNLRQNQKGFTIVELLIVVVVIAILAAMSIVMFTNISDRASTAAAKANASSVRSAAETYAAMHDAYPSQTAQFTSESAKLPSEMALLGSTLVSVSNGKTSIDYDFRHNGTSVIGARIQYWNFEENIIDTIYIGDASASSPSGEFHNIDTEV